MSQKHDKYPQVRIKPETYELLQKARKKMAPTPSASSLADTAIVLGLPHIVKMTK